jgi:hypothetical protein
MTPEEREAEKKRDEEEQKKWDYGKTPEGKREFAAFMVQEMKNRGILPPNIDHLWLNLPSGWAEYRDTSAGAADEKPGSSPYLRPVSESACQGLNPGS